MNLEAFTAAFGEPDQVIDLTGNEGARPTLLVRYGKFVARLQFAGLPGYRDGDRVTEPHLCIDVHPFVGGEDARAGVFGMERGRRVEVFDSTEAGGTSHGWPAVRMVAVLIGEQG